MSTVAVPKTDTIQVKPSVLQRVLSVDAYRGFVMLLMMAEVTQIAGLNDLFKEKNLPITGFWSRFWSFLSTQQTHVEWRWLSLHDMIQPSFSFLVGVALVYSLLSRYSKGQSFARAAFHALWRSILLISLGIFLRSQTTEHTYFTFEDTLSQIGLGYFFLFLIGHLKPVGQWIAFAVILIGYWLAFVLYPAPGDQFDYSKVIYKDAEKKDSEKFAKLHHPADNNSIAAHFNKNSNLAWKFDQWFFNKFRWHGKDSSGYLNNNDPDPADPNGPWYKYNKGGYVTLSFIPTLATMILGLIAGGWLRITEPGGKKVVRFILAGLISLAIGVTLDLTGICPSVKRIWTPSWVLVSGGICLFFLAAFYFIIDFQGFSAWSFPFRVIGANSIVAYFLADAWGVSQYPHRMLETHLGATTFDYFGPEFHAVFIGFVILAIWWLILYWLYRKKIYVKI